MIKTPSLDIERLKISLAKLVDQHDSFRLRYKTQEVLANSTSTTYIQYYDNYAEPRELHTLDIKKLIAKEGTKELELELQKILTDWQSGFNLENGPMYTIGYIYGYKDGSTRIYFAVHHLLIDTVSWRILLEDLKNSYNQENLGLKGSSYRQWVETVKEYAKIHNDEIAYWHNLLNGYEANKFSELITNENAKNYASLDLTQEKTQFLLRESNRAYNTEVNDILLTALGYALSEIANNKINYIVLEGHGREEIDNSIDLTRTVGWFTTMYPVKLEVKDDIGSSIKNIKECLRHIPNKGIGYGALIGYKSNKLPRISFNYVGQFNQENQNQNVWNIVSENSGESIHYSNNIYNSIAINGLVINDSLKFYITSSLDEETTIKLAELFKQKLEEIISYTVTQPRNYLTVSDVGEIISQEYLDKLQGSREIQGVYLANSLQQGFIYHFLNQGDIDDAYLIQTIWQYNNELVVEDLKEGWSYAQKKFASLRIRFAWEEELVQIIDKYGSLDWRYIDISDLDSKSQRLEIKQIQEKDRQEAYDLKLGNLFRVYIIKQKEDLYTCIFSNHHAILDGWSVPILIGYIHDIYSKLRNDNKISLSIDNSYEHTQKYLQEHSNDNKDYWNNYLSQIEEVVDLSGLTYGHVKISDHKYIIDSQEETLVIANDLYDNLRTLGKKEGVTLNAILQYAWNKLLHIYGNSNQTIVGMTVSGRNIPIDDIENSVGLYINTLPLLVDHKSHKTKSIIESIKDIQDNINEINNRSEVNLAGLQKDGKRLFDNLFIYENYPNITDKRLENGLLVNINNCIQKLDYPLVVIAYEINNSIIFR